MMLSISGLHAGYGRIEALHGVDLEVAAGEIVALIGANGAGKSTLLMTICGVLQARRGTIHFAGQDITHLRTFAIVRLGIAQSPEGRRVFPRMTVLENLQMGAGAVDPAHFAADLERVLTLFPVLRERQAQRGGTLSGGEQQMLAIGRALMNFPRLLMLDEPSLGLSPVLSELVFERLAAISRLGTTILLVEQNATCLDLATGGIILANGRVALAGDRTRLEDSEFVRRAYLGV